MRYRRLGHSDLRIPVLSFGCGNFGGVGSAGHLFGRGDDEETAYAMLDAALAAGITMFDTADSYGGGRSEEWLGRWLAGRGVRDEVMVTTKVGNRVGPGPHDAGLSAGHIRGQVDESLRRLRTDRVDLYLTHVHDPATPIEETIGAFDDLVRAGKIRHYGMSNFSGAQLEQAVAAADRLGTAGPVNLQGGYNLLDRTAEPDAFGVCDAHGVGFTAFSPLAGGWLTGKYRPGQEVPAGSRLALLPDWYGHLPKDAVFRILGRFLSAAAERDVAPATLALAWVVTDPSVTSAIMAPRTPEQLAAMCAAVDLPLPPEDRAAITRTATGAAGE
ncbi:aldo/keto reductase [Sphaerisporangium perillae]|uniref:aldo/keto reductase n=1 Tax=Sphaerisporangium perillae TaxID=2935860 RepID=UPI00200FE2D0|nr:aldo/keto reductase [Sphaerisporangium perillae]